MDLSLYPYFTFSVSFFQSLSLTRLLFFNFTFLPLWLCLVFFFLASSLFLYFPAVFQSSFPPFCLVSLCLLPLSLAFISSSFSASLFVVDQTAEAAKLPEARADRGAALSDLPPSPERQTNADMPISCKETIIHHLYQLCVPPN